MLLCVMKMPEMTRFELAPGPRSWLDQSPTVAYGGVGLNVQNTIGWFTTEKSIEPEHELGAVGTWANEALGMPRTDRKSVV